MVDIVNTVIGEISLAPCKGDFEPDGDVDGSDLNVFTVAYAAGNLTADLNNNGEVDINDLALFAAKFGRTDCCSPPQINVSTVWLYAFARAISK